VKTALKDKVGLLRVAVFAEIAVLSRRPDLQRLCGAASESGLSLSRIEAVLPGLSEAARRNLIYYCQYLRLIDESGRLTELGKTCATTGEAPLPEQGVYSFWVANHPAFGVAILHFCRERPDPFDRNVQDLEEVSPLLEALNRARSTAVAPKQRLVLRSIPTYGDATPLGRVAEAPGDALLRWDLDLATGENRRWLEGKLDLSEGEKRRVEPFRLELDPLPRNAVLTLFPAWDQRWDAQRSYVAIDYDGSADADLQGRDTFRRTFRYAQVELLDQGRFQNVAVQDVPVGPTNADAAANWALRLLLARLLSSEGYIVEEAVQARFNECVKGTALEAFRPAAPSMASLLQTLEREGTAKALHAFWRVAAPLDLSWLS
jgi:hypothetical protein